MHNKFVAISSKEEAVDVLVWSKQRDSAAYIVNHENLLEMITPQIYFEIIKQAEMITDFQCEYMALNCSEYAGFVFVGLHLGINRFFYQSPSREAELKVESLLKQTEKTYYNNAHNDIIPFVQWKISAKELGNEDTTTY